MYIDFLIGPQDFSHKFLHVSFGLVLALSPVRQALWWEEEQRSGYQRFHKNRKDLDETVKIDILWS